jgi:KaiC/GvpD/RAD55 family RecA-like ATPase
MKDTMTTPARLTTGIPALDQHLGGGLLPGTLTLVVGATGIGKTQLGLHFSHAGKAQEGKSGIIFDMTSRGDSQSQADYARRMFDWQLHAVRADQKPKLDGFFDPARDHGDYLHVFDYHGRRVTRNDLDEDAWRLWQSEVITRLGVSIAFFYGNFVTGVRRAVIDGLEPADRPGDSIQLQLFDYIYHQILRKEPDWVARDLFRQDFRRNAEEVTKHQYDPSQVACMVLYTSQETMLDDLISRPLEEGGLEAGANTIILMGKIRDGNRIGRGLYVAKHRGSACSDEIIEYTINDQGLQLAR